MVVLCALYFLNLMWLKFFLIRLSPLDFVICFYCHIGSGINLQFSIKRFFSTTKRELLHFNHLKIKIKSGQYLARTGIENMARSAGTGTGFPVVHCVRT